MRQVLDWLRGPRPCTAEAKASVKGMIASGDFKIDVVARTATLRDQELRLTCEEFDVLVFLVDHRQRVVTPRTRLATTPLADHTRQTEFLRALISLGKKLDAAGAGKRYLRTEPWVMYRFDPTSSTV